MCVRNAAQLSRGAAVRMMRRLPITAAIIQINAMTLILIFVTKKMLSKGAVALMDKIVRATLLFIF